MTTVGGLITYFSESKKYHFQLIKRYSHRCFRCYYNRESVGFFVLIFLTMWVNSVCYEAYCYRPASAKVALKFNGE